MPLNTDIVHPSWQAIVFSALKTVDPDYLGMLAREKDWLPGEKAIFNAFSLPLAQTHYILFGESPYPRKASANGYAFWDARVLNLWSTKGLDSRVNRATSLRNILKMLLIAEGKLAVENVTQDAIATCDKTNLIKTGDELFQHFLKSGILLLNASLVLSTRKVRHDAAAWRPFMAHLLEELKKRNQKITLLLFGKIAHEILSFPAATAFPSLIAEHPYNLSFVTNEKVIKVFRKLHLLRKT